MRSYPARSRKSQLPTINIGHTDSKKQAIWMTFVNYTVYRVYR